MKQQADRRPSFDAGVADGFCRRPARLAHIPPDDWSVYWRGYHTGAELVMRLIQQVAHHPPVAVAVLPPAEGEYALGLSATE